MFPRDREIFSMHPGIDLLHPGIDSRVSEIYLQPTEIHLERLEIDLQPLGIDSEDPEIYLLHLEIDSRCKGEHLHAPGGDLPPREPQPAARLDAPPPPGRQSAVTAGHGPPVQMTSQGPREER